MKDGLLIIILGCFIFIGCKKEQSCPTEYHMGNFTLLPTSIDVFPYKDSVINIVFKDSLGNEIELVARKLSGKNEIISGSIGGYTECRYDDSQDVYIRANIQILSYFITLPFRHAGFYLRVSSEPDFNVYDEKHVKDVGFLSFADSMNTGLPTFFPPQLFFLMDIRNSEQVSWTDQAIPVINLSGRTFQNVYKNFSGDKLIQFYYNNDFGLIGFRIQPEGILYVLDRFE